MKLELHNLGRVYRTRKGNVQALSPTSFSVGSGEFVSLVGPSGCGKSTTLYLIAGLDSPTHGRILLDGKAVTGPGAICGVRPKATWRAMSGP